MTQRWSSAQQQTLVVAGVRAIVVVVQLMWLVDTGTSGPAGPLVAAWLLVSVLVVAAVAARREPWPGAEAVVAAVDVAAVVAVTVSAPAGSFSVSLLALLVLVQVPLRWGLTPALGAGALLGVVGALHPAPALIAPGGGAAAALVEALVVVIALGVRAVLGRQVALGEPAAGISALTLEHSPAGTALIDAAGVLLSVNPTLARWCASTPKSLVGRRLRDLVHPGDAAALAGALDPDCAAGSDGEVRLLTAGQARWVRLLVAHVPASAARPALCVVQVEDATEHRATAQRLTHDALHDTLTGLPNRRALSGELAALLASPGRAGALVMIDLDAFKAVNDSLGHDAGDELLRVVAARLRSALRPGDVAGRLSGDELLVIARGVADDDAAEALGHRVLHALLGPASLRAGAVALRASIGLRRITTADHDAASVTRDADAALYRAKREGGCRVRRAEAGEGDVSPALPAPTTSSHVST